MCLAHRDVAFRLEELRERGGEFVLLTRIEGESSSLLGPDVPLDVGHFIGLFFEQCSQQMLRRETLMAAANGNPLSMSKDRQKSLRM